MVDFARTNDWSVICGIRSSFKAANGYTEIKNPALEA